MEMRYEIITQNLASLPSLIFFCYLSKITFNNDIKAGSSMRYLKPKHDMSSTSSEWALPNKWC